MALPQDNLAVLSEQAFERRGDYDALLFEGRWHSSGELFDQAARLAGGLRERGIAPGERVAVCMANCPEVSVCYQAIWRAGAVVTPATFLLPPDDLRHVLADAGAAAVITTPEFAEKVREATAGLDHVRLLACAGAGGAGSEEGLLALEELMAAEPAQIVPRDGGELAALLYTGGTTGRAKGVMLSHANLCFTGRAAHQASHVPGLDRGLGTLPLSHAYGLLVTVAGFHSPERPVAVLLRWFDPARFLEMVQEHGIQVSAVVPSMLQILLGQPLEDYELSSLRYLTSGGAPLAAEVEEEFRRRVPGLAIRQGYGLTETAALISTNPIGAERPGSVGLPVPGTELRILADDGTELPPGEPGEICCRSPGVMQGYWRAPEATEQALREGWLYTGDIGYLDEDGYLYVVDRKKDLIIRGGFNVYPRDVEDALVEHPDVTLAGVVGRPDRTRGEEVVAFVALRPGASLTAEELVAWSRERIGGYKYPREVHVVEQVPLTPVGKIDRKALRAQLQLQ